MNNGPFSDLTETESGLVAVPIQWTSGATGAVPALSAFQYHQRVVSVTRNSTGNFTIVYDAGAVGVVGFMGGVVQATPGTGGLAVKMTVNNMGATSAWSITIEVTVPQTGAATDPTTNDVVWAMPIFQTFDCIRGV